MAAAAATATGGPPPAGLPCGWPDPLPPPADAGPRPPAPIELGPDGALALKHALSDPRFERPYGGRYWQLDLDGSTGLRSRSLPETFSPVAPAARNRSPYTSPSTAKAPARMIT